MKRMRYKKYSALFITIIILIMSAGKAYTAGRSSTNYTIAVDVIDEGGGGGSASYHTLHAIGQSSVIGESSSSSYNNYAGFWYQLSGFLLCTDNDKDTYAVEGGDCGPVDCDDTNAAINPDAVEVCDGLDNNCDDNIDEGTDSDGDGYDSLCGGDCDDSDSSINPGAAEIWYDGVDQDCDGWNDYDQDMDTYVDTAWNSEAGGTSPGTDDCDDNNFVINPGTYWYADNDVDDYGNAATSLQQCTQPSGYVLDNTDCNDSDATVNPGVAEVPYNGKDDDCNAATPDDDVDGDTYPIATDCDDNDPLVNPGVSETCDGIDNNCDGLAR